jgi:hypothetical protein
LGLVKSYFSSFFGENKIKKIEVFFCGAPDALEDQAICLFAGLLPNPDMALSPWRDTHNADPGGKKERMLTELTELTVTKTHPICGLW